jgi:hypothetical protein
MATNKEGVAFDIGDTVSWGNPSVMGKIRNFSMSPSGNIIAKLRVTSEPNWWKYCYVFIDDLTIERRVRTRESDIDIYYLSIALKEQTGDE